MRIPSGYCAKALRLRANHSNAYVSHEDAKARRINVGLHDRNEVLACMKYGAELVLITSRSQS